jgi:phosphorylcholine metabolism protein LicD
VATPKTAAIPIDDAIDIYRRNSDYAFLKEALEANPKIAKKISDESVKFLERRKITKLYRAGTEDGVSYSYTKQGAQRFADKGAAYGGAPETPKIIEVSITPELKKRIIAVQGIAGNGSINVGEDEVILRPLKEVMQPKKSNFGK